MYRILLVDDEPIAIEALKSGVDWESLQISDILTANDMAGAVEILKQDKIDIMLCDIEMPNGTGLDLIRWVNAQPFRIVSIFLTCHSEFTYAKEAVALNVMEYILKPVDYKELTEVLKRAIAKVKETSSVERARHILSDIRQDLVKDTGSENRNQKVIDDAKKYMLENLGDENLDCRSVAAHVYLNPDYLSRIFKEETGLSVKNHIIKMRIAAACELLTNTKLSISKIAFTCGYSHMAHFSKMFKQETRMTPNEYRAKYLESNPGPGTEQ